jgi:hypothetical protein
MSDATPAARAAPSVDDSAEKAAIRGDAAAGAPARDAPADGAIAPPINVKASGMLLRARMNYKGGVLIYIFANMHGWRRLSSRNWEAAAAASRNLRRSAQVQKVIHFVCNTNFNDIRGSPPLLLRLQHASIVDCSIIIII